MEMAWDTSDSFGLLESILDRVPSAVVVKDRNGVVRYANSAYADLHGRSVEEVVGIPERAFISDESARRFHLDDLSVLANNQGGEFADELPTPNGVRYFKTAKFPLHDRTGYAWAVCAIATEVTAGHRLQIALRKSRDHLRKLAEWSPGMVYQFRRRADGGYDIPYTSRGIQQVFEVEPADVHDDVEPLFSRVHPDDLDRFLSSIQRSDQECTPWQEEFRVMLPTAGLRWVRASSTPERVDGGTVWHGYAEDITSRKLSEQEVWHRANYDSLTGLPNRDLAIDRLEQAILLSRRSNTCLAVIFADLDGFKEVNDTYGHAAGDQVLATVGARLHACVRESDTVARLGGDEFLVVLPATENPGGTDRVQQAMASAVTEPLHIDGSTIRLRSVSMGVAVFPDDATSAADLVAVADQRMYAHKHGRSEA